RTLTPPPRPPAPHNTPAPSTHPPATSSAQRSTPPSIPASTALPHPTNPAHPPPLVAPWKVDGTVHSENRSAAHAPPATAPPRAAPGRPHHATTPSAAPAQA